ncbi:MAG: response regulator transcription factor [Thermoanaerobaculia bacterium]
MSDRAPAILVVEDDRKTAASLRLYLEHGRFDVTVAHTGRDGLAAARARTFDLVVLDLMLPEIDGLAVCRAIRAESEVPVLMLTARSTEDDTLAGLGAGADDYVTKPFSPRELVARVRAILRRARPGSRLQRVLVTRSLRLDPARHEVLVRGEEVRLTRAEFGLLVTFARFPGRTFTRDELVEQTFGSDFDGLERSIDAHVTRLRRKIEAPGRAPSIIVTVFGIGYKLDDSVDQGAPDPE